MAAPPAPKKSRRSGTTMPDESIVCEDDEADSPYTLYFAQLADGNPTRKESENFELLYKSAKDSGLMPEWIDENSVDRVQASDDFFVVPCFRGKLFRKMQARKLRVFGPPIVFESLEEGKQLPQWTHPIFSSVFEGAKISFTAIDPEKKRELKEMVSWMGGVVGDSLYHESTHLVAGRAEQSEKYKVAVSNSIKLMRIEWIQELWEISKVSMGKFSAVTRDAVNTYSLRVFEGLEMALTSIDGEDRTRLTLLVEEHGGKLPGNMSRSRCSHLITDSTNSQKYKKAVEWKTVVVVQTRWIRKCIDLGHLIDETKYHPKFLSSELMRSSTPRRDANMTETAPDISSIAGRGGRLSISSFNTSSLTPGITATQNPAGASFFTSTQNSNVASSTINREVTHLRQTRSSNQFAAPAARPSTTPLVRTNTVPLVRHSSQVTVKDPIDDLLKMIDNHDELFENLMIYVCGVEEANMMKWRRFVDITGGTRVRKFESATNVVVVAPSLQEKATLRKFSTRDDIAITNSNWLRECLKERKVVPHEDFEWTDSPLDDAMSQQTPSTSQNPSERTMLTSFSEPPPVQVQGIFASLSYFVHDSIDRKLADQLAQKITANGGIMAPTVENAEFVVFSHSALVHELIQFDTVITDFYIDTCILNHKRLKLGAHALFVPLPSPLVNVFNTRRFYLHSDTPFLDNYVKKVIESKGGVITDKTDSKTIIIMIQPGVVSPQMRQQTVDLSWIISSMSKCKLQPIGDHLYKNGSNPLDHYQREDDVWVKCTRERDTTEELEEEEEVEDRHQVEATRQEQKDPKYVSTCPIENPYFPDLRQPYKMRLQLDGISEIIDNIPSPSQRDSPDSLTKSFVGRVLRKAVQNTGRPRNKPEPRPPSVVIAENRRTVSSTPVLQRNPDRFVPMDEEVMDQNQEHVEELNRRYAMHPHFLLTTTGIDPETIEELTENIQRLGGIIHENFNSDVSILISRRLKRTPKTLSVIAAGKWCLTPEYVIESAKAGHWLNEEPFEWGAHLLTEDAEEHERELAAVNKLWRIHVENMPITHSVSTESRHNGAFSGWRCVVHLEDKKAQPICPIIEAGGAVVFSIAEYIEVATHQPTIVLASSRFDWHEQSAEFLRRDRIPLYNIEVIYDFLVNRNSQDRSKHLHSSYQRK